MGKVRGLKTTLALAACVAAALVAAIGGAASSGDNSLRAGAVYAMTNQVTGNAIVAFDRAPDGTLTQRGTFPTGGRGSGGFDQSENSVVLSGRPGAESTQAANHLLYVTNAGSNDVSVFRVENDGLTLASRVSSGGTRPTSVTANKNLVYVLNAGSLAGGMGGDATISGFTVTPQGELTPLPGSTRPLSGNPLAGAAQVQFDPKGNFLVVSERNANVIDTFAIGKDGLPTTPTPNVNSGVSPFGFAFTTRGSDGQLVVAQGFGAGPGLGGAASYKLNNDGTLTTISPDTLNGQDDSCWVVLTNSKRYAYVSNFFSDTISSYLVASDGTLTLLNPEAGRVDPGGRANDEATSIDTRFLYVRNFTTSTISAFRIEEDGSLTQLPGANAGSPLMGYGLAAR